MMAAPFSAAAERIALLERELEASKVHARALQKQNDELIQLAVASQLLGGAADRDDVLDVIEEIVVNMIGSEDYAIVEKPEVSGGELVIVRARGIGAAPTASGTAFHAATESLTTRRMTLPTEGSMMTVVPLAVDATSLGAIVVFQLLGHKRGLDNGDHALLELLSHHAAKALFFTTVFRSIKQTVRPPARPTVYPDSSSLPPAVDKETA